jgi:hypothetical protein
MSRKSSQLLWIPLVVSAFATAIYAVLSSFSTLGSMTVEISYFSGDGLFFPISQWWNISLAFVISLVAVRSAQKMIAEEKGPYTGFVFVIVFAAIGLVAGIIFAFLVGPGIITTVPGVVIISIIALLAGILFGTSEGLLASSSMVFVATFLFGFIPALVVCLIVVFLALVGGTIKRASCETTKFA